MVVRVVSCCHSTCIFVLLPGTLSKQLVLFLFQPGAGRGTSGNITPMTGPVKENMGGSYAGANEMVNNGLSANQNQVSLDDTLW